MHLISDLTLIYLVVWLLGLCLGSFINAAALRSVQARDWVRAPSICFSCKKELNFFQNLPVYGWLRHGGKAVCCGAYLPKRYLFVELFCGALAVLVFHKLGLVQSLSFTVFFVLNCVLFLTDIDDFRIPDWTSLGGLAIGLILSVAGADGLPGLEMSLWGAAFGFGLLYGINFLYRLWRGHDGLGFGDVKLMAMYGAWLGPLAILPIVFSASIVGAFLGLLLLLINRLPEDADGDIRAPHLPFGVFLVPAAFVWILAQDWIPLPIIPINP